MGIEKFYQKHMCQNCSNKCNKMPHIIRSIIKRTNQSDTFVIKCEEYKVG